MEMRALRADIDGAAWHALYSTVSRPFDPPSSGRVAVEINNYYGDEALKVIQVKAYMHNGVFKSLEEVVHFYNTRDALPPCAPSTSRSAWGVTCWPAPEVPENVNTTELGDLGLTANEEFALVAFLKTLSDGFMPGSRGKHLTGRR